MNNHSFPPHHHHNGYSQSNYNNNMNMHLPTQQNFNTNMHIQQQQHIYSNAHQNMPSVTPNAYQWNHAQPAPQTNYNNYNLPQNLNQTNQYEPRMSQGYQAPHNFNNFNGYYQQAPKQNNMQTSVHPPVPTAFPFAQQCPYMRQQQQQQRQQQIPYQNGNYNGVNGNCSQDIRKTNNRHPNNGNYQSNHQRNGSQNSGGSYVPPNLRQNNNWNDDQKQNNRNGNGYTASRPKRQFRQQQFRQNHRQNQHQQQRRHRNNNNKCLHRPRPSHHNESHGNNNGNQQRQNQRDNFRNNNMRRQMNNFRQRSNMTQSNEEEKSPNDETNNNRHRRYSNYHPLRSQNAFRNARRHQQRHSSPSPPPPRRVRPRSASPRLSITIPNLSALPSLRSLVGDDRARREMFSLLDFEDTSTTLPHTSVMMEFFRHRQRIEDILGNMRETSTWSIPNLNIGISSRLPTRKITKSEEEAGKKCMICHEEYKEGQTVKTLPCIHCFHVGCIDPWIAQKDTCPECRHKIHDNDVKTEDIVHVPESDDEHDNDDDHRDEESNEEVERERLERSERLDFIPEHSEW